MASGVTEDLKGLRYDTSMRTILAFIAHPDDEAYSFAGTLALAARKGWRCVIHCATHGERGERHDGVPANPSTLADTREEELIAACEHLRIERPQFWGLPDGELHLHRGEERRIQQLIAAEQPDLLLSLGPDGAYGHPDHIAVHQWVTRAWSALDEPPPLLFAAFPPGLFVPQYEKCVASGVMGASPALTPGDIGSRDAHYEVDIRARSEAKLRAIAAHRSQLPGGAPHALFPPGIVDALLEAERYEDAAGVRQPDVAMLLDDLSE